MSYRYMRYEFLEISEFMKDVGEHWDEKCVRIQRPNGKWIDCTALRLKTFYRAFNENGHIKCVSCGLEASYFAVECSPGMPYWPHANLYGTRNKQEILFTHDHTLARALGGADSIENTTVMCAPCNNNKSKEESREVSRRRKAAGL